MKEKLAQLRASIKALLDDSEKLINEGKFEEAKTKQTEAKTLREQAEVIKAQLEAVESEKVTQLETENAELKAKLKEPQRLPFEPPTESDAKDSSDAVKAFTTLKYGELEASVKAVIHDLYGVGYNYEKTRLDQMNAFVKYVRLGEAMLSPDEHRLLIPSAKNLILRPDMIKAEISSGRSVGEIKATLEEGSASLGGYLVPEDYRTEIIKRLMGSVVVRGRARVVTTTRDSVEWPRLEGGNDIYTSAVRVTWVDETPASATAAETNPTFGLVRIPVHTVMARTNLSRNLLEDSAFNLLDIMADLFAEAMAIDEDAQFLVGTGAGRPYGVLGDRANGNQESIVAGVTDVNSGDAAQVTADGIVNLVYSLGSQYRGDAVCVMTRNTQRDIRKLKDGDGRYMWQPGLTAGQPPTLLGHPIYESQSMPEIAALNYVVVFGNWRAGYVIVDRVGMSVERVTDSTTVGQNQVAFFARRRLGGQVVAPYAFAGLQIST